jgi:hypothetical protein
MARYVGYLMAPVAVVVGYVGLNAEEVWGFFMKERFATRFTYQCARQYFMQDKLKKDNENRKPVWQQREERQLAELGRSSPKPPSA